ncbi:unnamed protein product [Gordionus sp. m RMFG-2023]
MLSFYRGYTFASTYEYVQYFGRWRYWFFPSLYSTYLLINLMAGLEIARDYLNLPYICITSNAKYIRGIKIGVFALALFVHLHNIVLFTVRETSTMNDNNIKIQTYSIILEENYRNVNLLIMICLRILTFNLIPLGLLTLLIANLAYLYLKKQLHLTRTLCPWIVAKYKYNKPQPCKHLISLNNKDMILEFTCLQELSKDLDSRDHPRIKCSNFSDKCKNYFENGGDLKIFLIFTLAYYPLYLTDLISKIFSITKNGKFFDEMYSFNVIHNIFKLWSICVYSVLWLLILKINKAR